MKPLQHEILATSVDYGEDMGGAQAPSIDVLAILAAALRRWKLITMITLFAMAATYGALKFVPSRYKSTVEILVYDPQQQINAEVQKPISPFVDAVGNDAMTTEIDVLKSKSVALRVASELGLDKDPEFQPHNLPAELADRLGFSGLGRALKKSRQTISSAEEENAERLDLAADGLLESLQVWQEAYILFVTTTSNSPIHGAAIGVDYREGLFDQPTGSAARSATAGSDLAEGPCRRSAIPCVGDRGLNREIEVRKRYPRNGIQSLREQQIGELNTQLMQARTEVEEKRARLEQLHSVIDTHGDVEGIPELTASVTLTELRRKQAELEFARNRPTK